ncbi:MAG: hypothetical protein CMN32_15725 [Saprospirales bacterium]|nr:hypothetical protein [Saprospirales bacterium]
MKNFIFLFFLSILPKCDCGSDPCISILKINAFVNPYRLNYALGDTITVTSSFLIRVPGFSSNGELIDSIDISDLDIIPTTGFYRIDTLSNGVSEFSKYFYFIPNFDFNYGIEKFSSGDEFLTGKYKVTNDSMRLKVSFSTKKEGVYCLSQTVVPEMEEEVFFPGGCHGYEVHVTMNETFDNHLDLLESSPDPFYNTFLIEQEKELGLLTKRGMFCFIVE